MTNRQTAAKMVATGLQAMKDAIGAADRSVVAREAGKHHTSQKAADKVKDIARKFIDSWIERMTNTANPKPRKVNLPPLDGEETPADDQTVPDLPVD